jgi:hypothetical protein
VSKNKKMRLKIPIASIAVISLAAMLVGTVALGAETSVTATVTAQVVALSITAHSSIAYGTVTTTADTTSGGLNESPTVRNDGSVNEDFQLKGTDSTHWTLAGSAGDATYAHKECHSDCDGSPSWTALTTSYGSDIFSSVAPNDTNDFDLQITVPTSNAGTSEEDVDVYVQATAS